MTAFSAALCRGLIEAPWPTGDEGTGPAGFPRLYAAASLKPEASGRKSALMLSFPRLYAAASLKRLHRSAPVFAGQSVFRGFMPRPH